MGISETCRLFWSTRRARRKIQVFTHNKCLSRLGDDYYDPYDVPNGPEGGAGWCNGCEEQQERR